jgi:hypothetical protein
MFDQPPEPKWYPHTQNDDQPATFLCPQEKSTAQFLQCNLAHRTNIIPWQMTLQTAIFETFLQVT